MLGGKLWSPVPNPPDSIWPDGSSGPKMLYLCPEHGRVEPFYEGAGSPRAGEPRCPTCVNESEHVDRVPQLDPVPVLPASLSEELADALQKIERLAAMGAIAPARVETITRRALKRYRKAIGGSDEG